MKANKPETIEEWFYQFATKEPDGTYTLILHEVHGWENTDGAKQSLRQLLLAGVPEEKKASKANPDNGSNNHSFRLGYNHCLKEIKEHIERICQ